MKVNNLRQYNYFTKLTDEELKKVLKKVKTKEYKKGEIIFFEGETGKALFMLEEGKVKLVKMKESGEEQILSILQAGSIFAEVVIFNETNYPATAIVLEKTRIAMISKDDMKALIKSIPKLALELLEIMSTRLIRAQKMVGNLGLYNTETITADILLHLATESKSMGQNKDCVISISQQELANLIGCSRETASRILRDFKKKGLIETARKKIIIKDLTGLKKIN